MAEASTQTTEIGLVLQGGGALGAYEYGAITALLELIDGVVATGRAVTLKAIAGVSIGAINAACVVGAANRADARRRLAALWNDLVLEPPLFWPPQAARELSVYGVPHFYAMRPDLVTLPSWTYIYDTHPLLQTLVDHIDFAELNASQIAFVITAVDVERGVLKRFANQKVGKTERTTIEPRHVLASGSLAPQLSGLGLSPRDAHRKCGSRRLRATASVSRSTIDQDARFGCPYPWRILAARCDETIAQSTGQNSAGRCDA